MKFLIFVFLLSSLFIFNCFIKSNSNNYDLPDEDMVLYAFLARVGDLIEKKYQMSQCGIGGGVDNGIWLMSLAYDKYGPLFIESDARKLLIECVNDFLKYVNEDKSIWPYLKNYPFKVDY